MMAPTIDQMIAEHIGQDTVLPSLEVASETTVQSAACGTGACYYSSTLSFRNPTTPLPMEFNPRKVFVQLFGAGDTPEERDAISRRRASVLDMINERTNDLQGTLGPQDRVVLEDYLESVRETERRVAKASQRDLSGIELPDAPIGELPDFDEQVQPDVRSHRAGLSSGRDARRVLLSWSAKARTEPTTTSVCPTRSTRCRTTPTTWSASRSSSKYRRYHVERFAEFVDKLANIPDGEGSLLDHSMLMYGSNMSNSDRHNNYPLPIILVGGACGALRGGQHVTLPEYTTLVESARHRAQQGRTRAQELGGQHG